MSNSKRTPEHCPQCGRFISEASDPYYDTDPPAQSQEDHPLMIYCDERCRDLRAARYGLQTVAGLREPTSDRVPQDGGVS